MKMSNLGPKTNDSGFGLMQYNIIYSVSIMSFYFVASTYVIQPRFQWIKKAIQITSDVVLLVDVP